MSRKANILFAATLACVVTTAWAVPKRPWEPVSETRFYTAMPLAGDDTVNPLRGYHRWQNQLSADGTRFVVKTR